MRVLGRVHTLFMLTTYLTAQQKTQHSAAAGDYTSIKHLFYFLYTKERKINICCWNSHRVFFLLHNVDLVKWKDDMKWHSLFDLKLLSVIFTFILLQTKTRAANNMKYCFVLYTHAQDKNKIQNLTQEKTNNLGFVLSAFFWLYILPGSAHAFSSQNEYTRRRFN